MKTRTKESQDFRVHLRSIKPFWFLLAGILTITTSHMTFNVDLAGWVAMVPFLIYLSLTKGWKSRALFALTLIVAWSAIVSKIITDPIPVFLIPLYSIPIGLIHLPGYLLYAKFRNHQWGGILFPASMVVLEWIQYTFTPFGSWGVAAYTQSDSLPLLQSLSLFGLAGLSFIIYWTNASIAGVLMDRRRTKGLMIPVLAIVSLLIFGSLRYDLARSRGKDTMTLAAVGTDSEIRGLPLPSWESNEEDIRALLARTGQAAESGAELVVWNEAAFYLEPENESQWLDSISTLSKEHEVAIVASYIVLLSESPFQFENKFQFFNPDGSIGYEYLKHEPVPGEAAVKGTSPFRTITVGQSGIGGAICYDYDFPYVARRNHHAGADIVALPSSDWRGIDPLHTEMAAFRAIEQGHSIIRSTRFGLSAAISPYGEMTSRMSSFDRNTKIMMAQLPANGMDTVYSSVGDVVVYLSIAYLIVMFSMVFLTRRKMN